MMITHCQEDGHFPFQEEENNCELSIIIKEKTKHSNKYTFYVSWLNDSVYKCAFERDGTLFKLFSFSLLTSNASQGAHREVDQS